tara:strand:+ start:522 stop:1028 length:507 start_codon:yes stop_codon:yes gene_type:complete
MKQLNLFFDNKTSEYFSGQQNLYLGDKDFFFADEHVNIQAEIKTISKNGQFTGKKMTLNQVREYAAMVDKTDNYGRVIKCFLFEYHKYNNTPFVIAVPIILPNVIATGSNVFDRNLTTKDFLDINKAKMLYLTIDQQFNRWLEGSPRVGKFPKYPLLCVELNDLNNKQ